MNESPETAVAIKSPISIGQTGIQVTTLDELWRFSQYVSKTEFCPPAFRNDPGATLVALEYAIELRMPMLQGLQNIMVVNGRAAIWGDLMLALVESSGLQEDFYEDFEGKPFEDDFTAICIAKRRGRSRPTISRFAVLDAKVAKLWANQQKKPWIEFPRRMLQMRARAFALRDTYPDVLRGLYSREEAEDMIDLTQTAQGYALTQDEQTALPQNIATQLQPPPKRPGIDQIRSLQELMTSCGVMRDEQSGELRKVYPHLAQGRLTQKYLAETLTIEEHDHLVELFTERLQAQVEDLVPNGEPPQDITEEMSTGAPQEPTTEYVPERQQTAAQIASRKLVDLAREVDEAEGSTSRQAEQETRQTVERYPNGLPGETYLTVEAYLRKRLNTAKQQTN